MARRTPLPAARHPQPHPRHRRRGVRRARLRRDDRRPHRPPRPRQQGDDLLPLPEQARALHHHRPRAFHADRREARGHHGASRRQADQQLDRLIETLVDLDRRLEALSADLPSRDCRRRRASRRRGTRARRRHLWHRSRRHRRGHQSERVPADSPRARALHDHRSGDHVPRDGTGSGADRGSTRCGDSRRRSSDRSSNTCRWLRAGCWRASKDSHVRHSTTRIAWLLCLTFLSGLVSPACREQGGNQRTPECRVRSKPPKCRWRRRSAGGCSTCSLPKAIAQDRAM